MEYIYDEVSEMLNVFEHIISTNPKDALPICRELYLRIFTNESYIDTRISVIYHPKFQAFSLYNHQNRDVENDQYNHQIFQEIGTKQGFDSIGALIHAIRQIFPQIYLPIAIAYTINGIQNPEIYVQYNSKNNESVTIFQHDTTNYLPGYIAKHADEYTFIIPKISFSQKTFNAITPLSQIYQYIDNNAQKFIENFSIKPTDELNIHSIKHHLPTITYANHRIHIAISVLTKDQKANPTPSDQCTITYQLHIDDIATSECPIQYIDQNNTNNDANIINDIYTEVINNLHHQSQWSAHTKIFFLRALQHQYDTQRNHIIQEMRRIHDLYRNKYIYTHVPAQFTNDEE